MSMPARHLSEGSRLRPGRGGPDSPPGLARPGRPATRPPPRSPMHRRRAGTLAAVPANDGAGAAASPGHRAGNTPGPASSRQAKDGEGCCQAAVGVALLPPLTFLARQSRPARAPGSPGEPHVTGPPGRRVTPGYLE